jgi:hypothetical protein
MSLLLPSIRHIRLTHTAKAPILRRLSMRRRRYMQGRPCSSISALASGQAVATTIEDSMAVMVDDSAAFIAGFQ